MQIFGSILSLAFVIGIVVIVVVAARRRVPGGVDAHSVRRFFQYVLLFALYVVVALGLAELLGRAFGAVPGEYEDPGGDLAQALAFLLVGGPVAAGLSWWTWRRHRAEPDETDSGLFVAYVTITALVSLFVAATALQGVLADALGGRFDPDGLGVLVAWGAVWAGHWWLARRAVDTARGAPHLLLGSLVGLAMAAAGLVMALGAALDVLLRPGTAPGTLGLFEGASLLVTGALVWAGYWLVGAARLPRDTWWLAFVLLAGVGGGLVAILTAASQLLWSLLVWFVGDRAGADAATHFASATTQFATLVSGGLVWWYHRTMLGERREERTEVRRVYEYLVAGIGLIAAAAGVGTVLVAFVEAVTPGVDFGMTVRNTLLGGLTALLVGAPVWWLLWSRIRRAVASDPGTEVPSLTRRIYLVVLFGIAGIAAVVALIAAAVILFNDVVDAQVSGVTIRSMRYALGVLVATAAVSAYHGAIFGQDRARGIARARGPRSIVLVGPADPDAARALARATGARVEVWGRLDVATPPWDADALGGALAGMGGDLLVVADPGGWRVVEIDPSGRRAARDPGPAEAEPS
ncbi:MAG: DUF5671 domain-containing protein [Propionicimonas sp.]